MNVFASWLRGSLTGGTLALALLTSAPVTAGEPVDGEHEFARYCAVCHGADARGDGPYADKLRRKPSDLTALARKNGGAFPETLVYRIVDGREMLGFHGSTDMPIWGDRFSSGGSNEAEAEARIDALVRYVESLQRP